MNDNMNKKKEKIYEEALKAKQKQVFKKDDLIEHCGEAYKCIVADDDLAVFGVHKTFNDGSAKTSYEDVFVVSQKEMAGFKFKYIKSLK